MPNKVIEEEILPKVPHYLQELPHEDEERLEKLFNSLDKNSNGRIDIHDLSEALREYGLHHGYAEVCALISFKLFKNTVSPLLSNGW